MITQSSASVAVMLILNFVLFFYCRTVEINCYARSREGQEDISFLTTSDVTAAERIVCRED